MTVTFWEDAATGAEARICKAGVAEGRGLTDPRVRLFRLAVLAFLPLRDMDNPRFSGSSLPTRWSISCVDGPRASLGLSAGEGPCATPLIHPPLLPTQQGPRPAARGQAWPHERPTPTVPRRRHYCHHSRRHSAPPRPSPPPCPPPDTRPRDSQTPSAGCQRAGAPRTTRDTASGPTGGHRPPCRRAPPTQP